MHLNNDFGSEFEVRALRKGMDTYCGFLIFGLIWLLIQNGYLSYNVPVLWISNCFSLLLMDMSAFYWFVFAVTKLSGRKAFANKKVYSAALLPIAAAAVICAVSPWTGLAFTITADGHYYRGPLFIYISSVSYLYDLVVVGNAVFFGIHAKNEETKKLCRIFGICIIFPMAAGAIQLLIAGTPIIAPSVITALFLVFVTIQSSQINSDALTGLNNRRKTYEYIEKELSQSGKEYSVIIYMIDANNFKMINDQYGHVEGDRALRAIADTLIALTGRFKLFVSRYGGDEFMMIDCGKSCCNPNLISAEFANELQRTCEREQINYSLTASIGYAVSSDKDTGANELIKLADENLYKAKAKLHIRRDRYADA